MVETTDTTAPEGEVIRQSPGGGETAEEGDHVTIVVSAVRGGADRRPVRHRVADRGPDACRPARRPRPEPAVDLGTRQRMGSA